MLRRQVVFVRGVVVPRVVESLVQPPRLVREVDDPDDVADGEPPERREAGDPDEVVPQHVLAVDVVEGSIGHVAAGPLQEPEEHQGDAAEQGGAQPEAGDGRAVAGLEHGAPPWSERVEIFQVQITNYSTYSQKSQLFTLHKRYANGIMLVHGAV